MTHPLCSDEIVWYPHQKAYIFTFLLSSRLFIEPRELLARVCHLCIQQQQLDKPVLDKVRSQAGQGPLSASVSPGSDLTVSAFGGGSVAPSSGKKPSELLTYLRPRTCKNSHP